MWETMESTNKLVLKSLAFLLPLSNRPGLWDTKWIRTNIPPCLQQHADASTTYGLIGWTRALVVFHLCCEKYKHWFFACKHLALMWIYAFMWCRLKKKSSVRWKNHNDRNKNKNLTRINITNYHTALEQTCRSEMMMYGSRLNSVCCFSGHQFYWRLYV